MFLTLMQTSRYCVTSSDGVSIRSDFKNENKLIIFTGLIALSLEHIKLVKKPK